MKTTPLNHAQTTPNHARGLKTALREPRNHAVNAKHALTTWLQLTWFPSRPFGEPLGNKNETPQEGHSAPRKLCGDCPCFREIGAFPVLVGTCGEGGPVRDEMATCDRGDRA